jgi:tubulin gamma
MPQSKEQKIEETKANLPLPDQPPTASDWQSADARTVNVGSGGTEANIGTGDASKAGLREPASKDAQDLSNVGRQAVEGELPKDAAYKK